MDERWAYLIRYNAIFPDSYTASRPNMFVYDLDLEPLRLAPVDEAVEQLVKWRRVAITRQIGEEKLLNDAAEHQHEFLRKKAATLRRAGNHSEADAFEDWVKLFGCRISDVHTLKQHLRGANPLLLATAIAMWRITGQDPWMVMPRYASGLPVERLEQHLIDPRRACGKMNIDLDAMLDEEARVLAAMERKGLELVCTEGTIVPDSGRYPTRLNIFGATWFVVNPVWASIDYTVVWSSAFQYGFELDNAMHSARETFKVLLKQTEMAIDALPREKRKNEAPPLLKARKQLLRMIKRALLIYYYAPHEIHAYAGEMNFHRAMLQSMAERGEPLDDKVSSRHAPFMLPDDVRDMIVSRWMELEQSGRFVEPIMIGRTRPDA